MTHDELVEAALTHPLAPLTRVTPAGTRITRHALCLLAETGSVGMRGLLVHYQHATPDAFEACVCVSCMEPITWTS